MLPKVIMLNLQHCGSVHKNCFCSTSRIVYVFWIGRWGHTCGLFLKVQIKTTKYNCYKRPPFSEREFVLNCVTWTHIWAPRNLVNFLEFAFMCRLIYHKTSCPNVVVFIVFPMTNSVLRLGCRKWQQPYRCVESNLNHSRRHGRKTQQSKNWIHSWELVYNSSSSCLIGFYYFRRASTKKPKPNTRQMHPLTSHITYVHAWKTAARLMQRDHVLALSYLSLWWMSRGQRSAMVFLASETSFLPTAYRFNKTFSPNNTSSLVYKSLNAFYNELINTKRKDRKSWIVYLNNYNFWSKLINELKKNLTDSSTKQSELSAEKKMLIVEVSHPEKKSLCSNESEWHFEKGIWLNSIISDYAVGLLVQLNKQQVQFQLVCKQTCLISQSSATQTPFTNFNESANIFTANFHHFGPTLMHKHHEQVPFILQLWTRDGCLYILCVCSVDSEKGAELKW